MASTPIAPDHPFYPLYNLLVDFKQRHVQPPSIAYVTRDDVLQLTIAAPIVATTVNLSLRFMSAQGEVLPRFETFTVGPTGATPANEILQNAEGYLLSASIYTPNAPRGQCFVSLAIKRGAGSGDQTFGDILLQGYPGQVGGLSYPQTPIWSALDGRGRMRSLAVANPAAGADFSVTVPAGVTWILRAVTGLLTSAVAVATRQVSLEIEDSTPNVLMLSQASQSQAASLAYRYSFFAGASSSAAAPDPQGAIPQELRLPAGWIVKSSTGSIQSADQWSNVVLTVEEFIGG